MAQFDVHRASDGIGLVVDCQSDLLSHMDSRFVAPLVTPDLLPMPLRRLNPVFEIEGRDYLLLTQASSAINRCKLGSTLCSLVEKRNEIIGAFDMLITGV